MAFVDELTIYAKAGDGGDGVVRWRHEKGIARGGPAGGDGGNGGNVYAKAVRNVHLLSKYRAKKDFIAERAQDGAKKSLHGLDGKDLDIELPIGSIVTNNKSEEVFNLTKEGERILLLEGGRGGRGNESFKSSTNTTPTECTVGTKGDEAEFFIEIELIADIGLIGLPNAGKSSLLNELTRACAKVGDYPFTTLEPNLGECFGYIISDIPGLIEGASSGRGLGHKFLRHVRRTKVLAHLVSLENDDPLSTYETIRKELGKFDPELLKKPEILVLSKVDIVSTEVLQKVIKLMKKVSAEPILLSIYDDESIKKCRERLLEIVKEK